MLCKLGVLVVSRHTVGGWEVGRKHVSIKSVPSVYTQECARKDKFSEINTTYGYLWRGTVTREQGQEHCELIYKNN